MASSETSKPAPSDTFVPTRSHLILPKQFCQLGTKYSNMSLWAVLIRATTLVSCACCLFLLMFTFNSFIWMHPGIGHFVSLVIEVHWVWICKLVFFYISQIWGIFDFCFNKFYLFCFLLLLRNTGKQGVGSLFLGLSLFFSLYIE